MRTEIEWTDEAWEHWGAVRDRIRMIRSWFGDAIADEHERELLDTFTRVTFAAGPVRVSKDGDGFGIQTPYIYIGLVWTPDTDQTRKQRLARVGFHYDNENTDDWPRTGRWSAHS